MNDSDKTHYPLGTSPVKNAYWSTRETKIEGKSIPVGELQAEYGCSSQVQFLRPEQVTMVDAEGNEAPYPLCDKCGSGMTCVMGRSVHAWICTNCQERPIVREREWISKEEAKEFCPDEKKDISSNDATVC